MARAHHFHIKEKVAEDSAGEIYRAYDQASGRKVLLRKYVHLDHLGEQTQAIEEMAYQVAIERLIRLQHPSLRRVDSGGFDANDGLLFLAARWTDAEPLQKLLKETWLSVEVATKLLMQLLELSQIISHLLGEDGIWVETDSASIAITGDAFDTHFLFWPAPVQCLTGGADIGKGIDSLITLTEGIMGWNGREVDERIGGHLHAWLSWLKDDADRETTTVREIHEMLAAAAGVEPPRPVAQLVSESTRKRGLLENLPSFSSLKKIQAPKMPLFVGLSILFVVQSIGGWIWIRKVSNDIDKEIKKINLQIYDSPYTSQRKNGDAPLPPEELPPDPR